MFGASRRAPRQTRSKQTADAIVEAAARVFAEDGLQAATTNRIALVAGVSVGSLYQYFPSKHALLTALFDRESMRLQAAFLRLVGEMGLDDIPALVRAYILETLDVFESNRPLYGMLFDEVPRFAGLARPERETRRSPLGRAVHEEALVRVPRRRRCLKDTLHDRRRDARIHLEQDDPRERPLSEPATFPWATTNAPASKLGKKDAARPRR